MITVPAVSTANAALSPVHLKELILAVERLERPRFVAKLADYAGRPLSAAIKQMPSSINQHMRDTLRGAILKCLEIAIDSLGNEDAFNSSEWMDMVMTGITGGVGGFFGVAGLPFELPFTATLMLRSIAEIARTEGEDLKTLETLLACLEVFALGGREPGDNVDADYYAVRMVLSELSNDMATLLLDRGAVSASSPIIAKFIGEIVGRLGLVVTDMSAASSVPIIGAVGGATVNIIFTDHFQRVARGHFTVRRLERLYGEKLIHFEYIRQLQIIQ